MLSVFMPGQSSLAKVRWTQHQWKENPVVCCELAPWYHWRKGEGGVSRLVVYINTRPLSPCVGEILQKLFVPTCSVTEGQKRKKIIQVFQGLWCFALMGSWEFGFNTQLLQTFGYGKNTTVSPKSKLILGFCVEGTAWKHPLY